MVTRTTQKHTANVNETSTRECSYKPIHVYVNFYVKYKIIVSPFINA